MSAVVLSTGCSEVGSTPRLVNIAPEPECWKKLPDWPVLLKALCCKGVTALAHNQAVLLSLSSLACFSMARPLMERPSMALSNRDGKITIMSQKQGA